MFCLQLGIGGYSSKQHVLLDKIMEKLTNFKVDPKRFEILKENVSIKNVDHTLLCVLTRTNRKYLIKFILFVY